MKLVAVLALWVTLFQQGYGGKILINSTLSSKHHNYYSLYNYSFYSSKSNVINNVSSWLPDSCAGRCGYGTDSGFSCQCNPSCERYNDCCSDYNAMCKGEWRARSALNSIFNSIHAIPAFQWGLFPFPRGSVVLPGQVRWAVQLSEWVPLQHTVQPAQQLLQWLCGPLRRWDQHVSHWAELLSCTMQWGFLIIQIIFWLIGTFFLIKKKESKQNWMLIEISVIWIHPVGNIFFKSTFFYNIHGNV